MTTREHPNYDLSIYGNFVGFVQVLSFQFIAATSLLAIGAYAIPAISGMLTKRVVQLINANRSMSSKTKEQSKTLAYVGISARLAKNETSFQGLAFQTFLPFVCYIPLPTTYIISQVFNVEMLLTGESDYDYPQLHLVITQST